jgi:hypothetical protein
MMQERPPKERIDDILKNRLWAIDHFHMRYEARRDYLQLCAEIDHLRAEASQRSEGSKLREWDNEVEHRSIQRCGDKWVCVLCSVDVGNPGADNPRHNVTCPIREMRSAAPPVQASGPPHPAGQARSQSEK